MGKKHAPTHTDEQSVKAGETAEVPSTTPDAIASAWEVEKADLIDTLQRLQADFENYRKRAEREKEELREYASDRLLADLLPIIDNLELAIGHAKEHPEHLLQGVLLIRDEMRNLLADQGVEAIPTEGAFDPARHEALMAEQKEGVKAGQILQVIQSGYARKGRILRPARVSVAR